jgi:hypothetical protein
MCPKIKRDMEDVMILCCFQYFERSGVTVFFEVLPSALRKGVFAGFCITPLMQSFKYAFVQENVL